MEQKIRKRHGALIFWLVFLAIAGGIAATLLLANNRRNLNLVLREIGIEDRKMVIPKPGAMESFKGRRIDGIAVVIPGHMLVPPLEGRDSAFLRTLENRDGEALCLLLRKEGFDMTPWEGGVFSKSVLECSYELSVANTSGAGDPSTFFLMVKGNAAGDLLSARAKVVVADVGAQAELAKRTADALKAFALHTHWLDFANGLPKVAALEPFVITSHGMTVRFQREFSGPGQFNLILAAAAPLAPALRRTRDYFERRRYWPLLPEHGGPRPAVAGEPVEG